MSPPHRHRSDIEPARSFDLVADAYDRARPSYPPEAVSWLLEPTDPEGPLSADRAPEVLELGAGTGKLTEKLLARGCPTTASDPSEAMLARLRTRAPGAAGVAARAEQLPVRARSADVVVAAQAFHWFDTERALPEVARVLRPRGRFALVWNDRDERVPWVRRLGHIIGGTPAGGTDPVAVIDASGLFTSVEKATFRFWQPLTHESLRELVVSRSYVAVMSNHERERVLHKVDALYAEYGRGSDGMLLPYLTTVYRTSVLPWASPPEPDGAGDERGSVPPGEQPAGQPAERPGEHDDDSLLIDFR